MIANRCIRKSDMDEVRFAKDRLFSDISGLEKIEAIHKLDAGGHVHNQKQVEDIINHYQSGHALPNGMEKARVLAMRGGYDCIEVYTDCCRAISSNGAVSVIVG